MENLSLEALVGTTMKVNLLFVLSAFFAATVQADQPAVFVGESAIPFVVVSQTTDSINTNSLAREFTA